MKRRLNVTKSREYDVFLLMISISVCRLISGGVSVGYKGIVLCFS